MVANIMSCQGFGEAGTDFLGACAMSWIVFVVIFFVCAVTRRQAENFDIGFDFIYSLVGGFGAAIITITLTAAPKFGLLAGLIGLAIGGFAIGKFTGGSE